MTDLEYEILGKLYQAKPRRVKFGDEVNEYLSLHRLEEWQAAIYDLVKDNKYIKFENGKEYIALTSKGKRAYEDECDKRQQEATSECREKKNSTISTLSLIVAIAAAAITLIQFLHSLFQ